MMVGYYIHNQQKDDSGVSKKIDAQMMVFCKHFDMFELVLEKKKESKIQRKFRQKILKKRPKILYDKTFNNIEKPDFIYIRKQILDDYFFAFLKSIKNKYPECRILMEVPTYPYWNEYLQGKIGDSIIEQEKRVILQLKCVIDLVVDVGNEKELFNIPTINIHNGLDPSQIFISSKNEKTESINLIAVAKWRDVHGYERIIDSMRVYYSQGGKRKILLHMVGDGPETSYYKALADNDLLRDKVIFYGYKTGEDLERIFDMADIGLGVFGFYKTGGDYVSAIKCAEYLMRGLPVVSAVDEEYLKRLEGFCYLGLPDDESSINMESIIEFYDSLYASSNMELVHTEIRERALEYVSVNTVMQPVIEYLNLKGKK